MTTETTLLCQNIAKAVCDHIDEAELDEVMNTNAVDALKEALTFIITREVPIRTASQPTPLTPAGAGTETPRTEQVARNIGKLLAEYKHGPLGLADTANLIDDALNGSRAIERELTSLRRQAEADRATREEQMQALGLCDDDRTVIADEIRRIRDEGRGYFHEITALRAQLASADKDRERLEWLMDYITNNGLDGLEKLAWTLYDEDGKSLMGREKVTEDEVEECRFDRATIDDGIAALPPSASLDHGAREANQDKL